MLINKKVIANQVIAMVSQEGPYENEHVRLQTGDIAIDAGANMGLFSLFCSLKHLKKVYAFEPQKVGINLLKKNIILNHATDLIEVVPSGLSDRDDKYLLSHCGSKHEVGSIVLGRNVTHDTEVIDCITLDNWVKLNRIPNLDFLKFDIEGAERNLLLGATETLAKFSPSLAIFTYHLPDDPLFLKRLF